MHKKRMAIVVAAVVSCTMAFGSVSVSAASATLKRETQGEDVKVLQQDLIRLGYLSTNATGFYGSATEEAVKQLQKEYGYKADGIAGGSTLSLVGRLVGKGKTSAVSVAANSKLLKEGDENSSVKEMQKKLIKLGYLDTNATGFFGPATAAAVKKLQKKYGYEMDGIAGTSTLTLLDKLAKGEKKPAVTAVKPEVKAVSVNTEVKAAPVSTEVKAVPVSTTEAGVAAAAAEQVETAQAQDEAAAKVEESGQAEEKAAEPVAKTNYLLPWYGGVEKTFAIGETATVLDIATGQSFKIKRTYGHNHADCETISAKDTAAMKKIFGGTWSWERRAVIITTADGAKIAGSMSGMPHAGLDKYSANKTVSSRSGGFGRGTNLDAVKKNNMNGVFDIHFYKSKNHYNNKIDPKHQALVKQAAEWAEKNIKAKKN